MNKIFTNYLIALSVCLLLCITANAETFVINSENFSNYFSTDGYLKENVPEGSTLDFQGTFSGEQYSLYINKKVDVITSTEDALFDSNTTEKKWIKFNVVAGADGTTITGLEFLNADLFVIGASNVTIDNIKMVANMAGVGQGTGFLSIHSGVSNALVKNSYFENGGTGSSIVVMGKGCQSSTVDNNEFHVTGSSGNILSGNMYVGTGDSPTNMTFTNNTIVSDLTTASSIMYGIALCGTNNLVEGNTINMKGSAITNGFGSTNTATIYRNNTILNGGTMTTGKNCTVENNEISGTLSVGEGTNVNNNTINSSVNVTGAGTTITENTINGTVTVKSNNNTITNNTITTNNEYAVILNNYTGNTVSLNNISAAEKTGDDAVSYTSDATANTIKDNSNVTAIKNIVTSADEYTICTQRGIISISNVAANSVCNLYNATGAHLAIKTAGQGTVTFEIPSKGIYIVEIINNGHKNTTKIVADK